MQNATQGERVIVDAPQYMISKIVAEENGVMFAESRVSHIIEETDSLYQKWLNYAMKFCFVVDAEEPFEDGDWIYGGGVKKTGRVFKTCPGNRIPHSCVADRATVPSNYK